MKRLSTSNILARERREHYYALRREGLSVIDAAAECEVTSFATRRRYEHWFQAMERGEQIVPGKRRGRLS